VRFVDSHLHLDSEDAADIIAFAENGGAVLLACGVDRQTSMSTAVLAAAHPEIVKPFVGIHPSEAKKGKELGWLEKAAEKASGVGEIGLDPTYSSIGPKSAQLGVFQRQLVVASRLSLPIQVHSRKAEKECLEILGTFGVKTVLMHWLEDEGALPIATGRGYYVSFGPALLYSKKLQRMARKSNSDLVLAESDSPVTYGPLGAVHGPSLIPSVLFKLAELWEKPFDETQEAVYANALRYLARKVNHVTPSGLTEVGQD
jgi:TatD DNase family protein